MATRTQVAKKTYSTKDQKGLRSVPEGVTALTFAFSNGTERTIALKDFPKEIQVAAAWHGLSQKLGDGYSGAKGDATKAITMFDEMLETLKEGQWVTASEGGGPRITQLAQAYFRAKVAAGEDITEEAAVEKVKGWDDQTRKDAAEVPQIAAALAAIRLEAAQKKAEELAKAAAAPAEEGAKGLGDF